MIAGSRDSHLSKESVPQVNVGSHVKSQGEVIMKKQFVMVAALATSLFLSAAHAGHGHKNKGKHKHKRNSPVVSYSIDAMDCQVTINSTNNIKRIVLKDDSGKILYRWNRIRSKSFNQFGMATSMLTDGNLYVISGRNSKRTRKTRIEIGDMFREELASCLDATVELCPVAITSAIDQIVNTNVDQFVDTPDACEIYGPPGGVGVYNGLSANNGGVVGATVQLNGVVTSYELSLEEADACQLYHGYCAEYDNRL